MSNTEKKPRPMWLKVWIYVSPLLGFIGYLIIARAFFQELDWKTRFIIGLCPTLLGYA